MVVLAASLALLLPAPAAANHPQAGPNATTVTFDHDGDNEWWVEVLTRASTGDSVVALEVRAESSSTFRGLQQKALVDGWTKWGPETAFRIPPGDRVVFRAHVLDGPTGNVATIDSCWFTHPAGAEQCATPPPPPPPPSWTVTPIGTAGIASGSGDMAVSDADNDGVRDLTVGNRNGVYFFEKSGSAWTQARISTLTGFSALAAGDGDGDGKREIYAMSNNNLVQYTFVAGVGWSERVLLTFPEPFAGDMTLGDIDGLAGPELYVGMFDTVCDPETQLCSSQSSVYRVRFTDGVVWEATKVAELSGSIDSMWIGNADNNGRTELYVGHGTRHADRVSQIQFVMGTWAVTGLPGTGSESGFSLVVAGDGNRDGQQEVYTLNYDGWLRMLTFDQASGWSARDIFTDLRTPEGAELQPRALFLGDGDGDGSQELYIATDLGQLYQVRWSGSAWVATRIANPVDEARGVHGGASLLVVGDADNDGRSEVYASVSFASPGPGDSGVTRVYQVKAPSGFDATFTGVRGNEWWVQANVATTGGTLAKVDVSLNGGAWRPLAKQSWGGWAASYHIPQGTIVQLRATSTTGATDLSSCRQWIPPSNADATIVPCGQQPPPPGFDASFTGVKGNEWWVQVTVSANQPVAKVEARVNCGSSWVALTNQGWGWAKSFHVPSGSKVDFRATSTTGATDLSGGYIWPSATPTSAC